MAHISTGASRPLVREAVAFAGGQAALRREARDDALILAESGDVLAMGYASGLRADARCRRPADQIERLLIDSA